MQIGDILVIDRTANSDKCFGNQLPSAEKFFDCQWYFLVCKRVELHLHNGDIVKCRIAYPSGLDGIRVYINEDCKYSTYYSNSDIDFLKILAL